MPGGVGVVDGKVGSPPHDDGRLNGAWGDGVGEHADCGDENGVALFAGRALEGNAAGWMPASESMCCSGPR